VSIAGLIGWDWHSEISGLKFELRAGKEVQLQLRVKISVADLLVVGWPLLY
jgi:hypothetical protein